MLKVEGDPSHPFTQGFACVKTYHYPERQHHPRRPLYPMRRVGAKGEGRFARISWDEALDAIATRLRKLLDTGQAERILPYHYGGTMGKMQNQHPLAFFRAIGAAELDETICATAGAAGFEASYGHPRFGVDPEDVSQARFIFLWGINSLSTNSHLTPKLKEARKNGAYIVHIDPYVNKTSRFADEHIPIRPASDAAVAYAMAHVIFREDLADEDYLERAAEGVEVFRAEALRWPPERAEAVSGVPAEVIERLARDFARRQPGLVRVGYGMTRHPGGASALRAVALLPALTGAWRYRGGGALLSTSGAFALNDSHLGGRHLLSMPPTPKGYLRPNPRARRVNMNQLASELEPTRDPGIHALFVFNSNPAVTAPDSARVGAGLSREDLFTVVLEQAMTETTRYADYVLPATTFAEHHDLYASYGHYYLSWNQAVLTPPGEARPNTWVFAELARRLGIEEETIYWDAETLAGELLKTDHPYLDGITLARLKAEGFVRLNLPRPFLPHETGAPTPSGRIRFAPPPEVILAEPDPDFPLALLTPPAHHFLNTTYGHLDSLNRAEGGEPVLMIHPTDAQNYGVQDGAWLEICSRQGEIIRRARVSEAPIPGTVVLEGNWWGERAHDGKPVNTLSSEVLTDLGGGSTFHANSVAIRTVSGP